MVIPQPKPPIRLNSLSYAEYPGQPREWTLEGLTLSQVNLIVGRNATGKTRTINIIGSLARLITGQQKEIFESGNYKALFSRAEESWDYLLEFDLSQVTHEELEYQSNDS